MRPYFWLIKSEHEPVLVFGNQAEHFRWPSIFTVLRTRGYVINVTNGEVVKGSCENLLKLSNEGIKSEIEYLLKRDYKCRNYAFESLFADDAEEINLFGKCISSIFRKSRNVSSSSDGQTCKTCNVFYPYAIANQDDGTLICWSCRNTS